MGLLSLPTSVLAARKLAARKGSEGSPTSKRRGDGAADAAEPVAEEQSLPTAEVQSWSVSVRRIYSQARLKLQQDPLSLRLPAVCNSPRSGGRPPSASGEGSPPSPVGDAPRSGAETPGELPEPSSAKDPSSSSGVSFRAAAPPPLGADLPSAATSPSNALRARGSPKAWASKGGGSSRELQDERSPSTSRLQRTLHAVQASASEGVKVRRATVLFQDVLKERKERLELEKAEQDREREHQRKVAEWKVSLVTDVVHSLDNLRSERRKSEFGEDRAQVRSTLADIDSMLGRLNALKSNLAMDMVKNSNITVDYASNIEEVKRLVGRMHHKKAPPRLSEASSKVFEATEALETAFELPVTKARTLPAFLQKLGSTEDVSPDSPRLTKRHSWDAKDVLSPRREEPLSPRSPGSHGLGARARMMRSATRTMAPAPVTVPLSTPSNLAKQAELRQELKRLGSSRSNLPLSRSSTQRSSGAFDAGGFGELSLSTSSLHGILPAGGSDSEPSSPGRPETRKIWNTVQAATKFILTARSSIKEEELAATPVPEESEEVLLPGVPATVAPELDVSVAPEDGAFSPRGRVKHRRPSALSLQRLKSQRSLGLEEEPLTIGSPPTSPKGRLLKGHSRLSLVVDPVDDSLVAGGTFVSSFRSPSSHTSSGSWNQVALAASGSGGLTAHSSMAAGEGGFSNESLGASRTRQLPSTPRAAAPGSPVAGSLAPLLGVLPRTVPRLRGLRPERLRPQTTIEGILLERRQRGQRRRCIVTPGNEEHWRRYAGDLGLPDGSVG